jgi:hypothetical protein
VGEYQVVAFGGIKFPSVHLPFADQAVGHSQGVNDVASILSIISLSFSFSLSSELLILTVVVVEGY